ncbi:MAG: CAP domain-containing protein, partial [Methanomicrobiales archaeon]|nr:CAP domain-containing protein [Methanomicrobiales archaeon]
ISAEIEQSVFRLTNEERIRYGLSALVWDDALAVVARDHSRDMAENGFFSHTNPAGEDPTARAQRHGYPTRKSLGGGSYQIGIAENIAKMPTGNVVGIGYVAPDAESVARALVQGWMDSPGHRENILAEKIDHLGVGVAFDGTYYLATQNFW